MKCLAILVNYHGARLIVGAAASLASDQECDWIHVIDNSESPEEAGWLRKNLTSRACLTVTPRNLGFAGACNLAFEDSTADCVLLLNPDARLFPGALARLKQTLSENPAVAAVGPRVYWDEERNFLLPPSTYPSRLSFLFDQLGRCWPGLAGYRARRFRQRALVEWQAESCFSVDALSGGHVLLRRTALLAAGGLFDDRFFMYWEDSDLMRRLQDVGFRLLLEPRAEAVHLYEHSPKKDQLIAQGWPVFAAKHFSSWGWRGLNQFTGRLSRVCPAPDFPVLQVLPGCDLEIEVPDSMTAGWLLEYSPSIFFVPAIGCFGHAEVARLPYALAQRFTGQRYYLRLSSLTDSLHKARNFMIDNSDSVP